MSDQPGTPIAQALKCSECGAKITAENIQPGSPIVCEYCGSIIIVQAPRGQVGARPPGARPLRPPFMRPPPPGPLARRALLHRRPAPLLHAVKLLTDKGAIDKGTLRKYTKRNIDRRMPPAQALRAALRQMKNDGKIKRDKVIRAVDELIAEGKLPPRARELVERAFD